MTANAAAAWQLSCFAPQEDVRDRSRDRFRLEGARYRLGIVAGLDPLPKGEASLCTFAPVSVDHLVKYPCTGAAQVTVAPRKLYQGFFRATLLDRDKVHSGYEAGAIGARLAMNEDGVLDRREEVQQGEKVALARRFTPANAYVVQIEPEGVARLLLERPWTEFKPAAQTNDGLQTFRFFPLEVARRRLRRAPYPRRNHMTIGVNKAEQPMVDKQKVDPRICTS